MTNPFPDKPNLFDEEGDSMAFGYGLGDGFKKMKPLPSRYKSAEANPYYYYPGFIIGYVVKVVMLVLAAKYGVDMV
jgi:hypothetical protein